MSDLLVGAGGAWFAGRRFACAIGRGGIGEKRREGDGVTPRGAHRIEAVYYRADRRCDPLGRGGIAIGPRDGWSDDPRDPAYNCRVRRPWDFSHEALRRVDAMYDMVAVLDWNRHPVAVGWGSAIFLHVWRGPRRPTAGCVAFGAADLAWILARWTPRGRVVVRG